MGGLAMSSMEAWNARAYAGRPLDGEGFLQNKASAGHMLQINEANGDQQNKAHFLGNETNEGFS